MMEESIAMKTTKSGLTFRKGLSLAKSISSVRHQSMAIEPFLATKTMERWSGMVFLGIEQEELMALSVHTILKTNHGGITLSTMDEFIEHLPISITNKLLD